MIKSNIRLTEFVPELAVFICHGGALLPPQRQPRVGHKLLCDQRQHTSPIRITHFQHLSHLWTSNTQTHTICFLDSLKFIPGGIIYCLASIQKAVRPRFRLRSGVFTCVSVFATLSYVVGVFSFQRLSKRTRCRKDKSAASKELKQQWKTAGCNTQRRKTRCIKCTSYITVSPDG